MIEGLHFDFPATEIKAHLTSASERHATRAKAYEESLAKLGGNEDSQDNIGVSNSGRADLKQRIKGHQNKAVSLRIMADHVVDGEVYRLDEGEMSKIELIDRMY